MGDTKKRLLRAFGDGKVPTEDDFADLIRDYAEAEAFKHLRKDFDETLPDTIPVVSGRALIFDSDDMIPVPKPAEPTEKDWSLARPDTDGQESAPSDPANETNEEGGSLDASDEKVMRKRQEYGLALHEDGHLLLDGIDRTGKVNHLLVRPAVGLSARIGAAQLAGMPDRRSGPLAMGEVAADGRPHRVAEISKDKPDSIELVAHTSGRIFPDPPERRGIVEFAFAVLFRRKGDVQSMAHAVAAGTGMSWARPSISITSEPRAKRIRWWSFPFWLLALLFVAVFEWLGVAVGNDFPVLSERVISIYEDIIGKEPSEESKLLVIGFLQVFSVMTLIVLFGFLLFRARLRRGVWVYWQRATVTKEGGTPRYELMLQAGPLWQGTAIAPVQYHLTHLWADLSSVASTAPEREHRDPTVPYKKQHPDSGKPHPGTPTVGVPLLDTEDGGKKPDTGAAETETPPAPDEDEPLLPRSNAEAPPTAGIPKSAADGEAQQDLTNHPKDKPWPEPTAEAAKAGKTAKRDTGESSP